VKRRLVLLALAVAVAAAPRPIPIQRATGSIAAATLPYLPGSTIPIRVNGLRPPLTLFLSGAGTVDGNQYHVGAGADASTIVASSAVGLAMRTFAIAPTPDPRRPFIAVASYDDGIVLHDATAPFRARAALGIAGAPGDIAVSATGAIATAATDGESATIATLDPWAVHRYENVPLGDEVAFDARSGALFVTNRELDGAGALTRITADGSVAHRVLGLTAEGIAIDPARQRVYVANVNDGTVSIVDAASMVELRRFHVVDRVFSLALSENGSHLFAVSNQSVDSPFASAGSVVAVDVAAADPHVVARSERLAFPIGVVFDGERDRLYVTDEDTDAVDVLDARTLRMTRAPLRTCETPWKPAIDRGLLFIPCARSDQIDVFDLTTLHRIAGAPFATGGYPLAVAFWHGILSAKAEALSAKVARLRSRSIQP
jgi:DNA-binding beta-propeller fold protein YncE